MKRILVVGMSGAGKTTAARAVAHRLGLAFHEMDTLALGPGWSTPADLHDRVDALCADTGWVLDSWGYPQVREQLWASADTVVWLDYRRTLVFARLARRCVLRTVRRERIYGGNRETLLGWVRPDHPLWHAVRTFDARSREIANRSSSRPGELTAVHLTSPRAFAAWLAALPSDAAAAD